MNGTAQPLGRSKWIRRLPFSLLVLFLLVAFFYAEEDLRGWLAWKNCEHELGAKGDVLDWNAYIPPPVPDDQNFFKAPKMAEWFVRQDGHTTNELITRLQDTNEALMNSVGTPTNMIVTVEEAANYLARSDQFEPDFNLIREALKRPYARMDGDYSIPYQIPIPNFIAVRDVARTLAQRAHCYLLLNQPEQALRELTLIHDMCRLLESAPTGKPMTLVAAMINVAVTGLYTEEIADGFRLHAWKEPQLVSLQEQLVEINLNPFVYDALQEEPAGLCRTAQILPIMKLYNFNSPDSDKWSAKVIDWLWPRGFVYQNMVNVAVLQQKALDGFDLEHNIIFPRKFEEANQEVDKFVGHGKSPYRVLAAIAIPNFSRAEQTAAHNQTMVNEAQIACALERYHLANGEYPKTLNTLSPHYIGIIPHDLIGGDPLVYLPTAGGKFLLYSIGWNEIDDDGQPSPANTNGGIDYTKGDWIWQYPAN